MNEDRFTGMASIYDKFRPTYPEAFVSYLYIESGMSDKSVIADIGAGTGILTELLLLRNSRVYAVEPNDDMGNAAKEKLSAYKGLTMVRGSAENTTLDDYSVDFVTVAQAFHWFDTQRFKSECKRILKQGGKVILVYNSRDEKSEIVRKTDEINKRYCKEFKGFSGGGRGEAPENYSDFFKDGYCEYKIFRNDLFYDEESFIGRSLSSSYAPKEQDAEYYPYIDALKALFKENEKDGRLCMPNITRSYKGEV